MILRNGIVQHKKYLKFLSNHFAENEKKKVFPNDSFLNNLKNAKEILSWQSKFSKFLQTYLLACSDVPHFSTKEEICDDTENDKLLMEKYGHFS